MLVIRSQDGMNFHSARYSIRDLPRSSQEYLNLASTCTIECYQAQGSTPSASFNLLKEANYSSLSKDVQVHHDLCLKVLHLEFLTSIFNHVVRVTKLFSHF